MMKHIYKWFFCVLLISCNSNDNNLLEDATVRGGFIQFVEVPKEFSFNLLNIEDFNIDTKLIDPNSNASSYSLTLFYNDIEIPDFIVLNAFPTTLSINIQMIVDALGLSLEDIDTSTEFKFLATVVTPKGSFTGVPPDFNAETNENEGGNTVARLLEAGLKDAMDFSIRFFLPPPYALRYTSFEEPEGANEGVKYVRNGGSDETGDLINGVNPPFVDYVAVGNTRDDEIGFDSEYISTGNTAGNGFVEEEIGVTNQLFHFDAYPDGDQGFKLEDIDGNFRINFDKVVVPAEENKSGVQIRVWFKETTWESSDSLHIYANVEGPNGPEVIDIVDFIGPDINSMRGFWATFDTGFLSDITSYQVIIDAEMNVGAEDMYFDNLVIYVPEP